METIGRVWCKSEVSWFLILKYPSYVYIACYFCLSAHLIYYCFQILFMCMIKVCICKLTYSCVFACVHTDLHNNELFTSVSTCLCVFAQKLCACERVSVRSVKLQTKTWKIFRQAHSAKSLTLHPSWPKREFQHSAFRSVNTTQSAVSSKIVLLLLWVKLLWLWFCHFRCIPQ